MSVLNRSMFQRPMPVVRRMAGTPKTGETIVQEEVIQKPKGKLNFFEKLFDGGTGLGVGPYADSEQGDIIDLTEYGAGIYDRKDPQFIEFIKTRYMDNKKDYTFEEFQEGIDSYVNFLKSSQSVDRAEGSPMQGEQVNAENVGIMDGFSGEGQGEEAEAMAILEEGQRAEKEIEGTETYDELMRSIRGDDLSEADRREELASYVGEKDAEETPDSVLTLVQPVMQMLDQDTANTGIGQIEEGQEMATIAPTQQDAEEMMAMNMTQQPVGVANGGYMSGFPNQNMGAQSLTASDNIDNRIMQNLQFERMAPGMMGYANGGQVQHFAPGGIAGKKAIYDPLYMELMEGYSDPEQNKANTLMDISQAALAYGRGDVDLSQGTSLFLDKTQKRVNADDAKKKALEMQLKSGSLSSSIAAQTAEDLAASNLLTAKAKKAGEKGTVYFKQSNEEGGLIDFPAEFNDIAGLKTSVQGLPNGASIYIDKNNKPIITLPDVPNKEAYFDLNSGKVVYFTDEELEGKDMKNLTTVGAGLTYVKIQRPSQAAGALSGETEVMSINISDLKEYLDSDQGWLTVPNSETSIVGNKETIVDYNQGGIVHREDGTPESGETVENEPSFFEGILNKFKSKQPVLTTESQIDQAKKMVASGDLALRNLLELKNYLLTDMSLAGAEGQVIETGRDFFGLINELENMVLGGVLIPDEGGLMTFFDKPDIEKVKRLKQDIGNSLAELKSFKGNRQPNVFNTVMSGMEADVTGFFPKSKSISKIDGMAKKIGDLLSYYTQLSGQYAVSTNINNPQKTDADILALQGRNLEDRLLQIQEMVDGIQNMTEEDVKNSALNLEMNSEKALSLLPPEMADLYDTDNSVKQAINAIMQGADVQLVIERYNSLKQNQQ